MTPTVDGLISSVLAAGRVGALAVTGGGSELLAELLRRGGGSAVLLEAVVPYALESLAGFLGAAPERACDEFTARRLATAAYQRARKLRPHHPIGSLFGLGLTAALAKSDERPDRAHRVFAAAHTAERTAVCSVVLPRVPRAEQERMAAMVGLELLARAVGVPPEQAAITDPSQFRFWEPAAADARPEWRGVLDGAARVGRLPVGEPAPVLLSGSFNPPHAGHFGMARYAAARLGKPVDFELSATHPDKPPLDHLDLERRTAAISAEGFAAVVTDAPLFADKARALPGRTFAVGADTWARILDASYYGRAAGLTAMLDVFAATDTRFLVFGRRGSAGFRGLAEVTAGLTDSLRDHPVLAERVIGVPEADFRLDLSSTEIRNRGTHLWRPWADRAI